MVFTNNFCKACILYSVWSLAFLFCCLCSEPVTKIFLISGSQSRGKKHYLFKLPGSSISSWGLKQWLPTSVLAFQQSKARDRQLALRIHSLIFGKVLISHPGSRKSHQDHGSLSLRLLVIFIPEVYKEAAWCCRKRMDLTFIE